MKQPLCHFANPLVTGHIWPWRSLQGPLRAPRDLNGYALAKRSQAAPSKAARRAQPDRTALRPFRGLLDHVATLTRNTNQVAGTDVTFDQLTMPTRVQAKAFELLGIPIPLRIM